jgi:hypothetical protein
MPADFTLCGLAVRLQFGFKKETKALKRVLNFFNIQIGRYGNKKLVILQQKFQNGAFTFVTSSCQKFVHKPRFLGTYF